MNQDLSVLLFEGSSQYWASLSNIRDHSTKPVDESWNSAVWMIEAQRMSTRSTGALYDHKPLLYNFHGRRDTLRYAYSSLQPPGRVFVHVSPQRDIYTQNSFVNESCCL